VDAFDADVLIYVAKNRARGTGAARLIGDSVGQRIGSVILLGEVFGLPTERVSPAVEQRLIEILAAIELKDVDSETAQLAAAMRGKYRLKTPDALHLATAVLWGAERFHTNNRKDFGQPIDEIEIVLP
jgi:predicted nucleic acid-binding protein